MFFDAGAKQTASPEKHHVPRALAGQVRRIHFAGLNASGVSFASVRLAPAERPIGNYAKMLVHFPFPSRLIPAESAIERVKKYTLPILTRCPCHMKSTLEDENRQLRKACSEATQRLSPMAEAFRKLLKDRTVLQKVPWDVQVTIEAAVEAISESLRGINAACPIEKATAPPAGQGPTRQQGQFLAFIREYVMRNSAGIAPGHADFQRYFNLTPPSVNSMLIRLQQRGFIRREPGKARAIELVVNPDWIPPLDRPFKF